MRLGDNKECRVKTRLTIGPFGVIQGHEPIPVECRKPLRALNFQTADIGCV
jgi:hypothetical protein